MKVLELTTKDRVLHLEGDPETEQLVLPAAAEEVCGLERFPNLRRLTYHGSADLLGFGDLLNWLSGPTRTDEIFVTRLATNLRAGRPISQYLTVFDAPHMPPPYAMPGWQALLDRCEDVIVRGNGYGRQDVCLCALTCGQLMRMEYALRLESDFTAEEQVLYGLSIELGCSWRDFYAVRGDHDYRHILNKDNYIRHLKKTLPLRDDDTLRQALETLLRTGTLTETNHRAAVELLLDRHLTEATAFLMDHANRHWGAGSFLDTEFAL